MIFRFLILFCAAFGTLCEGAVFYQLPGFPGIFYHHNEVPPAFKLVSTVVYKGVLDDLEERGSVGDGLESSHNDEWLDLLPLNVQLFLKALSNFFETNSCLYFGGPNEMTKHGFLDYDLVFNVVSQFLDPQVLNHLLPKSGLSEDQRTVMWHSSLETALVVPSGMKEELHELDSTLGEIFTGDPSIALALGHYLAKNYFYPRAKLKENVSNFVTSNPTLDALSKFWLEVFSNIDESSRPLPLAGSSIIMIHRKFLRIFSIDEGFNDIAHEWRRRRTRGFLDVLLERGVNGSFVAHPLAVRLARKKNELDQVSSYGKTFFGPEVRSKNEGIMYDSGPDS